MLSLLTRVPWTSSKWAAISPVVSPRADSDSTSESMPSGRRCCLRTIPPCSRSPRRPCCSCRGCWPPSGADGAREADGGRWAVTGRQSRCCGGSSTAPGWLPDTESAGRRHIGICTRASTCSRGGAGVACGALLVARAMGRAHHRPPSIGVMSPRCEGKTTWWVPRGTLTQGYELRWSGRGWCGDGAAPLHLVVRGPLLPACRGVSPSRGGSGQGQVAEVLGREDLTQPRQDA